MTLPSIFPGLFILLSSTKNLSRRKSLPIRISTPSSQITLFIKLWWKFYKGLGSIINPFLSKVKRGVLTWGDLGGRILDFAVGGQRITWGGGTDS